MRMLLALAMAAALTAPASATPETIRLALWNFPADARLGTADGVRPGAGGLRLHRPVGTVTEGGREYEYAVWTSPAHRPGFGATQVVPSWNAVTPPGTWLDVDLQVGGRWYELGRWASGDGDIRRTSVPGQTSADGRVDVDTFVAARPVAEYRLRVTLYRAVGTDATPTVRLLGAMASAVPDRFTVPLSRPGVARGIELPVPRYSQNTHIGEYPEYGGGGEAWCSPTSTEMVVEYWGRGPSAAELAWVDPAIADPSVPHAARHTFDADYDGTGNWPFNTAYAATFGLTGYVTRLRSLSDVEALIAEGVPVITSQSFRADELDGAGYGTAGHLMVIVGFTPSGDVIAHDPASPSNAAVRRVYDRAQFETIWLRTKRHTASGAVAGGTGGIAYVIRP